MELPQHHSKSIGALVRMYRHGLGDCFLVRLAKDDGGWFTILIDCGLIAVAKKPNDVMGKVVADIATVCENHLNLVIMTHEHWDHASGFSTQQMQSRFAAMRIDEVWYAWTEDPSNELGARLRRERESKLNALVKSTRAIRQKQTPLAAQRAQRLTAILGFFGVEGPEDPDLAVAAAAPGKTRAAFDYLKERRGVKKRYCRPDDAPVSFPGVSGIRAYVLGPPEDEQMLKRSTPTKKGREVYDFSFDLALDDSLAAAFDRIGAALDDTGHAASHDRDCPFEMALARRPGRPSQPDAAPSPTLSKLIDARWEPDSEKWRQIDDDWTAAAETLALNLDNHTNNTCLVIAFELLPSGRVLLFAADAQVGNWLSWQKVRWRVPGTRSVTGPDLLRRAVFYKVGHHGSHNATLRTFGLEQMTSSELVAFLPVFEEQAQANRWTKMPFNALVQRLRERTGGRLVFSDAQRDRPSAEQLEALTDAERTAFNSGLEVGPAPDHLYYEFSIEA